MNEQMHEFSLLRIMFFLKGPQITVNYGGETGRKTSMFPQLPIYSCLCFQLPGASVTFSAVLKGQRDAACRNH